MRGWALTKSSRTRDTRAAKYLGLKNLKNISRPIGVYALAGFGPELDSTSAATGRDWRSLISSRGATMTFAIAGRLIHETP